MRTFLRISICCLTMTFLLPAALLADDRLSGTWELSMSALPGSYN
jgi:hypothetical protein